MEKQELLEKMRLILSDLQKRMDDLSSHKAGVDEIELEWFSTHASHFADYAHILKILLTREAGTDKPETQKYPETPQRRERPRETESGEPAAVEPESPADRESAVHVPPPPAFPENGVSGESLKQETADSPADRDKPSGEPASTTLNERFQEKEETVHKRISSGYGQENESFTPIRNLSRSIGLNERYYFIKNLFSNDKVAFDQAITRIDMCASLGEAMEYINRSLAGKYGWSRKEEDARGFYELIKRRFI